MYRILYRSSKGALTELNDLGRIPDLLADRAGLFWLDIAGQPDASKQAGTKWADVVTPLLRDTFKFHPLAIEDAVQDSNVPKVDDWGEYLYITLHAVDFDRTIEDIDLHELDVFLGRNFVVTLHEEEIRGIDRVFRAAVRDERHTRRGSDFGS